MLEDEKRSNPEDLAAWLRKAGKAQRTLEFQCPYIPDFFVQITYASKFVFMQIRDVAREIWTNPRTREREERLNDDKLRQAYARQIVCGWRGLTVGKMSKLVPGVLKITGDVIPTNDTEIPFSIDIAVALLEVSAEFENWVLSIAMDIENYSSLGERGKTAFENLK